MTAKNYLADVNTENQSRWRSHLSAVTVAAVIFLASLAAPTAHAQTFQALHSFTGKSGGTEPYAGVMVDRAGNVYGTTAFGGFYDAAQCAGAGCGLAYKINPSGQEAVIHAFEGRQAGTGPFGGLLRARGNFYGTTSGGGDLGCNPPYGCGTVFKIDLAGNETVLYRFKGGAETQPQSTLIQDAEGNLYGTTTGSFPGVGGTVFKLDPAGNETVLHTFTGAPDGVTPLEGLVQDAQGNLYGGTELGGTGSCGFGCGTIYKISSSGAYSILYNFSGGEDGSESVGTLTVDSERNIYGMTGSGGDLSCFAPFGCGVIFKLDQTGTETVLYRFANETNNGWNPIDGVVRDSAGNFYGTTYRGGAYGMGTAFKLDTAGNETLLHSFTGGTDGAYPHAGLALDSAGNLYGTTIVGGVGECIFGDGCGVVFKIAP